MDIKTEIMAVISGASIVTHEFTGTVAELHRELDHLDRLGLDVHGLIVSRHGADYTEDVALAEVNLVDGDWITTWRDGRLTGA